MLFLDSPDVMTETPTTNARIVKQQDQYNVSFNEFHIICHSKQDTGFFFEFGGEQGLTASES